MVSSGNKEAYLNAINSRVARVGDVKGILLRSGKSARAHKNLAQRVSTSLGIFIAIAGVSVAQISEGDTVWRDVLAYLSASAGAVVSIISERFDPIKLREREVALGDLVYKLGSLKEDMELEIQALEGRGITELQAYLAKVRSTENECLEEAEKWKAGIRISVESIISNRPGNGDQQIEESSPSHRPESQDRQGSESMSVEPVG